MENFKVGIMSLCYNHSSYLRRTLDGMSEQKTNFDFVTVLLDDASTDDSQGEIKRYIYEHFAFDNQNSYKEIDEAILYFGQHKKNKHFYLSVVFLKTNYFQIKKSKIPWITEWTDKANYWGLCECDDYWIDENKLQEEVDFLDNHKDYGLVYTDYDIHNYDTGKYINGVFKNGLNHTITSFEDHLVKAGYIAPMSWLCRIPISNLINNYDGPSSIDLSFIMALEIFRVSNVYYMDKITCVYGKHAGSATKQNTISSQYVHAHGVYTTQKYYLEKYDLRSKYPNCLDYFINAYYCYILSQKITEDYAEVKSFFDRKKKSSIKFRFFSFLMESPITMPFLRFICKWRIRNNK